MITNFKLFEDHNLDDLVGKKVTLIDKHDALWLDDKGYFVDTLNDLGWSPKIEGHILINGHILIQLGGYYYNNNNFKIKDEVKRVYSPEDPYGEEEWENESVHNDIDPYGEEEWNEGDEVKYPIKGEYVLCIRNHENFREDNKYKVNRVTKEYVWLDSPLGPYQEVGFSKRFFYIYFESLENESVRSDIDPYDEENWNEEDEYPIKGNAVMCIRTTGIFKYGDLYTVTDVSDQGIYLYMPLKRMNYRINKSYFNQYFKKLD